VHRTIYGQDHEAFRDSVREFVERTLKPRHEEMLQAKSIARDIWKQAGSLGILGLSIPEKYGGTGAGDFRYNAVATEEIAGFSLAVAACLALHADTCPPYLVELGTEDQKARWLPGIAAGELVCSIAMTEPSGGSDLAMLKTTAVRDGDHWVVNGSKTFITNGYQADLVIVAARTDPAGGARGITLFVVEEGMPGFQRGRKLDKAGQDEADTAELFFTDVRVPAENLLGEENRGFYHLMRNLPAERLGIAIHAVAQSRRALELTRQYAAERKAFGSPIGSFQVNRHAIAEMTVKLDIMQVYVDRCIEAVNAGELTAQEAAGAKLWTTETQWEIIDRCLQMHGGYGYMNEFEIARLWRDSRVQRLYGGTSEIMRDLIGRSLGY
jgi:alkylation response protein AidB-like acyl-CoA dehydrogenase